jgi:hypothetical protein
MHRQQSMKSADACQRGAQAGKSYEKGASFHRPNSAALSVAQRVAKARALLLGVILVGTDETPSEIRSSPIPMREPHLFRLLRAEQSLELAA